MPAPEGNTYWERRDKDGRDKKYAPEVLWDKACDYFTWAKENPWYKQEAIKGGDMAGTLVAIPIERPLTISGLCCFADISVSTFDNYSRDKDYLGVVTRIREIIYTQKFEGAAVGAFNANIIARDLGMIEKKDVTSGGQPITDNKHEVVFRKYSKPEPGK